MKILVIANLYPSKSDPSYGTFVKNFVDGLSDKQNVEIELCVIRGRAKNKLAKLLKYVIFLSTALYLLMFRKYDLVYNHIITHAAISLRIATFFRDIPLVFNIHGEDLLTKTRISQYGLKLVTPLLYKAKLIVVPSNFFKKKTLEIFPCIDPKIIFVSASGGVSKKFFHLNTDCKISREKIVVGYVSRIDRGKGWNIFIDAIVGLKAKGMNIEGVLAGPGFQVPNMKDYYEYNKKLIRDPELQMLGATEEDLKEVAKKSSVAICGQGWKSKKLYLMKREQQYIDIALKEGDSLFYAADEKSE